MQFWAGTKRFPKIGKFVHDEQINMEFIEATANLWADVFGLPHVTKKQIQQFIAKAKEPKIGKPVGEIVVDEKQKQEQPQSTNDLSESINNLPDISELVYNVTPLEFEKDDDTNFHIDFVTCASNLRASNYGINQVDKFKTKGIAGKIIPAIITTTSLVSGLATIELLKILKGCNKLEHFTNTFANLAIPFIAFSEPIPVKTEKIGNYTTSLWHSFSFNNPTLEEVVNTVSNAINDTTIKLLTVDCGKKMFLNTSMHDESLQKSKLATKVTDLYKKAYKEDVPKYFTISLFFDKNDDKNSDTNSDKDGEDLTVCDSIACKIFS